MKPQDALAAIKIVGLLGAIGVAAFAGYKLYKGASAALGAAGDAAQWVSDTAAQGYHWVAETPERIKEHVGDPESGVGDFALMAAMPLYAGWRAHQGYGTPYDWFGRQWDGIKEFVSEQIGSGSSSHGATGSW